MKRGFKLAVDAMPFVVCKYGPEKWKKKFCKNCLLIHFLKLKNDRDSVVSPADPSVKRSANMPQLIND